MDRQSRLFRELYERHAQDVHRFALWLTGDENESEDLVADTFLRVMASREPIRTETVKAYLFAIARNAYLQRQRRKGRETALSGEVSSSDAQPDRLADASARIERVMAGLQSLPEIDRTAILLRAQQGLPYAEIARVLGCSESAIRVRVHRARLRLSEPASQKEENQS